MSPSPAQRIVDYDGFPRVSGDEPAYDTHLDVDA